MPHETQALTELNTDREFIQRHVGPGVADQRDMLATLGFDSLDQLTAAVVPASIRINEDMALAASCSESQTLAELRDIAEQNTLYKSLIGQGYYNCYTPSVILRNLLENPAWYTAYTPYQPEISQGRLEALLNFQTMVTDLTGMDLANASLLDEATAAAEAMSLSKRMAKAKGSVYFIDRDCMPQSIDVMRTRAEPLGIDVVVGDPATEFAQHDCFGILLQYPGASGEVRDYAAVIAAAHERKALVTMAADMLALLLLKSPAQLGVDVAIGSTQRFGVPLGFGGPHAAYMATRESFKRALPGRLVGVSVDANGDPAYRLALQTREQHIRREKATSNICTAQVLLAVIAGMYAVYHGPKGLRRIAERVQHMTSVLAAGLGELGYRPNNATFFDTVTIATGDRTDQIHAAARAQHINLRAIDASHIGISLDETVSVTDVHTLWRIFSDKHTLDFAQVEAQANRGLAATMLRDDAVLTHPVFNSYHAETEMMRYLRLLADKDVALDRAMIPLGSCTMKLNAATEMLPISWPEFSAIHPFVPADQAQGYARMIAELEQMLCTCTGYDAVSLQPNAGSQGEYAGLLAIRAYHASRGEGHRHICLIPGSAHGTNPASAQMCGMQVVVVKTDDHGNIDLGDLRGKAEQNSGELAAIMVTYPSTHGVFEEQITAVCEIIHTNGGQVYLDGANLNAMVGLCEPGKFGADVSHLNLHKTFCIPHGGGGPGVGPIGVGKHLAPFLPGHKTTDPDATVGPVSAAAWGSAGILPISWSYIRMMGRNGLTRASEVAILNANYVAKRLAEHYPILYTGAHGLVAHECIVDLRALKESSGISVEDVAKRLVDFGFHAPTMSWPVAGTFMIEPTESESRVELDRFCDAMICIRREIAAVEAGELPLDDNPLKNAPHTAEYVCADDWQHAYSRSMAAYPLPSLRGNKYWAPVGRIDNVYGDRNLQCSCPVMSDYE